ncbi:hypothetical protein KC318_g10026, partial [Hortaea werneckii]
GRCTNCQRFSQECVFTPVSAQTQAFVPAHTVWRGQNPPPNTQLYGAYGQPLPAGGRQEPYPPQQPQQPGQPGQYPQPPQAYAMYPNQPNMQQPGQPVQAGQKRPTEEPHTPTMPPPNPAEQSQQFPFGVANPAGASPASSTASFHLAQTPTQPYYHAPPTHRSSPSSAYSLDASRSSSSPHSMGGFPVTPAAAPTSYAVQPPTPYAVSGYAGTPPQGAKANDAVGQQQVQQWAAMQAAMKQDDHQRTSTDSSMVKALNRDNKDAAIAADGAVPVTTEGAIEHQEEVKKPWSEMKDAGVQTDLAFPPQGKELDSVTS